ncbi:TniQ family protein [Methylobacterium sp. J-072]|uniref:TniQ family protein n=1 Tax=Methylobacterium sp. J-072 TaxID=2836651 RepID=UPI001FBAF6AC|nr:TniQ family protein [Methylobacterium sp. J-072]MCJ2094386.1 TniQ family protein [Methylobacterium sp. J-072]
MSTLLPFLPLMPEESVTSYAARVTALHHGGSARAFLRCLGVAYAPIVAGDPDALAAFADLTAVPADDIARAALTARGHIHCFRGELVQQKMLRCAQTHICPRCLAADIATSTLPTTAAVYGRMIWQFRPIRACPHHHVLLEPIGEAGHGDNAHDFARTIASTLSTIDDRATSAQPVERSAAEAYLVARFSNTPTPSPLLDAMPWYAAARTCEAVGIVALHVANVERRALSEVARREAANHGFHIVHGGEASVRSFLDDLRGRQKTWKPEYHGSRTPYGSLQVFLTFPRPDPGYAPLRRIVHEHALQHIPFGPGDRVVGFPSIVDGFTRSRRQLSRPGSIPSASAKFRSRKGSSHRMPR